MIIQCTHVYVGSTRKYKTDNLISNNLFCTDQHCFKKKSFEPSLYVNYILYTILVAALKYFKFEENSMHLLFLKIKIKPCH